MINKYSYLRKKQRAEIEFWENVIQKYILWYQGELNMLYGNPTPNEAIKEKKFNLKENAIRTWIKIASRKYLNALAVKPDYFDGCRLLDVGCGPIPHLHCFQNVQPFGIDQLINEYIEIGFPLDRYDPQINYTKGSSENMPWKDNYFDAIVSVNAIDHVDDFEQTAREIQRILKPGGKFRMQVHYHPPWETEPWALTDDVFLEYYGSLGVKKIKENVREGKKGEKFVTWST